MNAEDESGGINPANKEADLTPEQEVTPTTNNNDVSTDQPHQRKKISFETPLKTFNKELQYKVDKQSAVILENESCSNNNEQNKESTRCSTEVKSNEDGANHSEMTSEVLYAFSDNTSNTIIQEEYSQDQEVEIGNIKELTDIIENEENIGTGKDFIFILRVQRFSETAVSGRQTSQSSRSRSRGNRIRPMSQRGRRRRRQRQRRQVAVQQQAQPEEPVERESEVEDVEYEMISSETVPCKMSRNWRTIPKYKRLTESEAVKQEADLFYNFLKETNPEEVVPAGPSDRQCCICYENKATRIVIPCGHLCLCYTCAKSIAFSRTTLASVRIPKRCPLCQAAISAMMRLL